MLPHFAIIPQQQQKRKNNLKNLERGKNIKLSQYASMAKKYIKGMFVVPLFDNPIVKKLKTYTKHSQFTKMKVQGNENEKKERERGKEDK